MPITDPTRVYDGQESVAGGMNGGVSPSLIAEDQCARLENATTRGGFVTTRPAFRDLEHNYETAFYYDNDGNWTTFHTGQNSQTAFEDGVFQTAHYYSPPGQSEYIMAAINGRLFKINPRPNHMLDITEIELGTRNSILFPIAYMAQADKYLVWQDGQAKCVIFDGVTARRAGSDEVPVGTIMAYGMGRLVVVASNKRDIAFGDLYGSHPGDPGESVLKFTETTFLAEGGSAAIAPSQGIVKGLSFTPQQDSSTGDGELLAFAERGVTSFFVSTPRDKWKESAFQRITLLNVGLRGHRAIVSINGDVWFRADDGFRSYRQARAEQQGWAHIPMSTEVREYIDNDTEQWLDWGSTIRFENRMIGTCSPHPNQGKLYHSGLLALDFDVLSSFGSASKPAWDGHWCRYADETAVDVKLKVTQLVSGMFHGEQRAFAFTIDENGKNHILELTVKDAEDWDGMIAGEMVTRSMTGPGLPNQPGSFLEKRLYGGDLWLDDIRSDVNVTVDYRPDQHPNWSRWTELAEVSPVGSHQATTIAGVPTTRNNFVPRKRLKKPITEPDCDFTGRAMDRGYEFQARVRWTGHTAIRKFRMHMKQLTENAKGECD